MLKKLFKSIKVKYLIHQLRKRNKMNQHETEFDYDKLYSDIHRSFGDQCYAGDIDFVEYCYSQNGHTQTPFGEYKNDQPVALIKVKCGLDGRSRREEWQRKLLINLAEPRDEQIPAFIIHRDADATGVKLFKIEYLNAAADQVMKKIFKESRHDMYEWCDDKTVICTYQVLKAFHLVIHGAKTPKQDPHNPATKKYKQIAAKHSMTKEQFHKAMNPPGLDLDCFPIDISDLIKDSKNA